MQKHSGEEEDTWLEQTLQEDSNIWVIIRHNILNKLRHTRRCSLVYRLQATRQVAASEPFNFHNLSRWDKLLLYWLH